MQLRGDRAEQHFTEPPPRFTEPRWSRRWRNTASAARRPMRPSSRRCAIASTSTSRAAVSPRRTSARSSTDSSPQYFTTYVDYGFTAKMEDELDAVAAARRSGCRCSTKFWKPFIELVEDTETSVSREEVAQARDLGIDPVSGKPMSVRMGRFGPFVQIGTKDDAEKPRFAGLRPGQKMDAITHRRGAGAVQAAAQLGADRRG